MRMAGQVIFELQDVFFTYPGNPVPALKNINLKIYKGEWLALIGSNGSGKSTLAKLLNALLIPSQGACFISGLDSRKTESLWLIRNQVAMVFQNPDNQIVGSVVEDDTAFGPENQGLPAPLIRERVNWALKVTGLEDFARKATYALSGGQKQRLAISGALAMSPPTIVFDEPTAMLDPQARQEIHEVLEKLHNQGMTIIYITHRLEEILNCDRVVVLDEGIIQWQGIPRGLFSANLQLEHWGLEMPSIVRLWSLLVNKKIIGEHVKPDQEGIFKALCQY